MPFDHIITNNPYGKIENAVKPWDSIDAEPVGQQSKFLIPTDPPEQVERCFSCPFKKPTLCDNGRCWYRLGKQPPPVKEEPKKVVPKLPKKKDEPQPPKGYDQEKLGRAMVHNYTDQEIADALGLSLYMTRKWLKWRYR